MRTVVKAITPRRVRDGWGNEMLLRRPVEAGFEYLADTFLLNGSMKCKIVKQLKHQEEVIENVPYLFIEDKDFDKYKKYL
jgi:hypothetical protein